MVMTFDGGGQEPILTIAKSIAFLLFLCHGCMYVCELLCGKCVNSKRTLIQEVEISALKVVPYHIKTICNQMNGFNLKAKYFVKIKTQQI